MENNKKKFKKLNKEFNKLNVGNNKKGSKKNNKNNLGHQHFVYVKKEVKDIAANKPNKKDKDNHLKNKKEFITDFTKLDCPVYEGIVFYKNRTTIKIIPSSSDKSISDFQEILKKYKMTELKLSRDHINRSLHLSKVNFIIKEKENEKLKKELNEEDLKILEDIKDILDKDEDEIVVDNNNTNIKVKVINVIEYNSQNYSVNINLYKGEYVANVNYIGLFPFFKIKNYDFIKDLPKAEINNQQFIGVFDSWPVSSLNPYMVIKYVIGDKNDFNINIESLLTNLQINYKHYSPSANIELNEKYKHNYIDSESCFRLKEELYKDRVNKINECIITIDPETAKDLDDGISIRKENGKYYIGVYIADVSNYVKENDELDNICKIKTSSFYFPNKVLHMLPEKLSSDFCSLNEARDRFSMGINIVLDAETLEIVEEAKIFRCVINNWAQISYEKAQNIIDNILEKGETDIKILNSEKIKDLISLNNKYLNNELQINERSDKDIINTLMTAFEYYNKVLSKKRVKLNMDDKTEYYYKFNEDGSKLLEMDIANSYTTCSIIEQLMILANNEAAKFIYKHLKDRSILRIHNYPKNINNSIVSHFDHFKLDVEPLYINEVDPYSKFNKSMELINSSKLSNLEKKFLYSEMCSLVYRSKYCFTKDFDYEDLHHCGLNLDLYTHFTSPIRRYADLMVHRIIGYILDNNIEKYNTIYDDSTLKNIVSNINAMQDNQITIKNITHNICLQNLHNNVIKTDAIVVRVINDNKLRIYLDNEIKIREMELFGIELMDKDIDSNTYYYKIKDRNNNGKFVRLRIKPYYTIKVRIYANDYGGKTEQFKVKLDEGYYCKLRRKYKKK